MRAAFAGRYGPWAVVAGGSRGLGAAFARELAARGCRLLLCARGQGPLAALAGQIRAESGVEVRTLVLDLGAPGAPEALEQAAAGLDVGLLLYNAAHPRIGALLDQPAEDLERALAVNCRAPLLLCQGFGRRLAARGRGGIILMSSLAGLQGSPGIVPYAAGKAFAVTLAEGLWWELRRAGVDVLACTAGAIAKPGLAEAAPGGAPGTLPAAAVAREVLDALGRGPRVTPGALNAAMAFVMSRLLPRRTVIRIMAAQTEGLLPTAAAPPG